MHNSAAVWLLQKRAKSPTTRLIERCTLVFRFYSDILRFVLITLRIFVVIYAE